MEKRIYFVGIGGISMSSLACILSAQGNTVSGSDIAFNENLNFLENFGIKYHIGHCKKNIKNFNPNIVVKNCAIKDENEEIVWAKSHNKKIITRAELLGKISKEFKNVIAISGTHGKTTTTALISEIFINAKTQPTVHIGGVLKKSESSFLIGNKKFFITEACEYQNSFLTLYPTVGIVLNIENDHLDFFKNISEIKQSFNKFLKDSQTKISKIDEYKYELKNEKTKNIYCAKNIKKQNEGYKFDFFENDDFICSIQTNFFGIHNVKNALVACIVARFYKIKIQTIKKTIRNFSGVKRRFEIIGKQKNCLIIHDYAHHPTEIKKVISQAKNFGKVLVVFQPHTFSRTKNLFNEFLTCFNKSDGLILLKTYPAREEKIEGALSINLFEKLITENKLFSQNKQNEIKNNYVYNNQKPCNYFDTFEEAKNCVLNQIKNYDCVLILGAGDINELAYMLKYAKQNNS